MKFTVEIVSNNNQNHDSPEFSDYFNFSTGDVYARAKF